jgi:hypothetical membrane protein
MNRGALSRLALLAPIGALLFTLGWLILGFVSPGYRLFDLVIEPYSPVAQPISGLGLGVTGPLMNTVFIVSGVLVLAGSLGVASTWPRTGLARVSLVLIGLSGLGLIVDGVFTLESVMLHLLGFLFAAPLPAIGFVLGGIALRRNRPRVATLLGVAGVSALVLFTVFQVIFDPYSAGDNAGVAGLVQRMLATVVIGTVGVLGAIAARSRRTVQA